MKILMLCPYSLKNSLGAAKVYMENAQAYKELGHEVTLLGGDKFTDTSPSSPEFLLEYTELIYRYILDNGNDFDVIEYEYLYLPLEREKLPRKPLLVARSILLELHLKEITIPRFKKLRSFVGHLIYGKKRGQRIEMRNGVGLKTLNNADAVTVANPWDKKLLIEEGLAEEKIVVAPYGLFPARLDSLKTSRVREDGKFKVCFVGTFDPRKGAVEFPKIVDLVCMALPECQFKLLGTSAMFPDAESVKAYFPVSLRDKIQVVEKFDSQELGNLLMDCDCGLFPSYLESFGFGVLEMMAASLPVACYKTPGPHMLAAQDWQAERGDYAGLVDHIVAWGRDKDLLASDQMTARKIAESFSWREPCQNALAFYERRIREIK